MSIIRWRLINLLKSDYTYGFITKQNRIKFNLEKTHTNDAFCIEDKENMFTNKKIFYKIKTPLIFFQKRRHNRSMSTFIDAKYIDSRDNSVKSGKDLSKEDRIYRKSKISKGSLHKQIKLNQSENMILSK